MKNAAQKEKERAEQESKRRRAEAQEAMLDVPEKPRQTTAEIIADLERRRGEYVPTLADYQERDYRRQSAHWGIEALKAFAEGDDVKGRYFAGHSFNLALHAVGRHPDYYPWLLIKYEKVHAFKSKYQE
jgi:hypothetical protein